LQLLAVIIAIARHGVILISIVVPLLHISIPLPLRFLQLSALSSIFCTPLLVFLVIAVAPAPFAVCFLLEAFVDLRRLGADHAIIALRPPVHFVPVLTLTASKLADVVVLRPRQTAELLVPTPLLTSPPMVSRLIPAAPTVMVAAVRALCTCKLGRGISFRALISISPIGIHLVVLILQVPLGLALVTKTFLHLPVPITTLLPTHTVQMIVPIVPPTFSAFFRAVAFVVIMSPLPVKLPVVEVLLIALDVKVFVLIATSSNRLPIISKSNHLRIQSASHDPPMSPPPSHFVFTKLIFRILVCILVFRVVTGYVTFRGVRIFFLRRSVISKLSVRIFQVS